uniref:OmpA family protein n=1 Tax=Fulvivirga sp. TaxID=1931237 RepID=UPI00404B2367
MRTIKLSLLLLAIICANSVAIGQNDKKYERHIKKADRYFFGFAYSKAIAKYASAISENQDNDYPILKIAEAYRLMNQPDQSAIWYQKIIDTPIATDQVKLDFSQVLMKNGSYQQAQQVVKMINDPLASKSKIAKKVEALDQKDQYFKDSSVYSIQQININSAESDFGPAFYQDGIVFASGRKAPKFFRTKYDWDETFFLNLYYSPSNNGVMGQPNYFSNSLNTVFHEGPSAFYENDTKVVFTRNNYFRGRTNNSEEGITKLIMFFSQKNSQNGKWKKPVPFKYNSPEYSVGHPSMHRSEKMMVFASDMPGSFGKVDLFKTELVDGEWSTPVNLGNKINTDGNEMFPFLGDDNKLYFASDAHPGLGGLDIFVVDLADDNSPVVNLGYPINTEMDDFGLILKGSEGYFSSNRITGRGSDDIYQFLVFEFNIEAYLVDGDTQEPLMGNIKVTDLTYGNQLVSVQGNERTTFRGLRGHEYKIEGDSEGYENSIVNFSTLEMPKDGDTYKVKVPLYRRVLYNAIAVRNYGKKEQVLYGQKEMSYFDETLVELEDHIDSLKAKLDRIYIINNIYYDLDKHFIRPDAAEDLDKLAEVMKLYPELDVELGSHTDSRASNAYNERLADRRVKAAKAYLKEKGIDEDRISKDSFGEYVLSNECSDDVDCDEVAHQLNRRTEIKLVINPKKLSYLY